MPTFYITFETINLTKNIDESFVNYYAYDMFSQHFLIKLQQHQSTFKTNCKVMKNKYSTNILSIPSFFSTPDKVKSFFYVWTLYFILFILSWDFLKIHQITAKNKKKIETKSIWLHSYVNSSLKVPNNKYNCCQIEIDQRKCSFFMFFKLKKILQHNK